MLACCFVLRTPPPSPFLDCTDRATTYQRKKKKKTPSYFAWGKKRLWICIRLPDCHPDRSLEARLTGGGGLRWRGGHASFFSLCFFSLVPHLPSGRRSEIKVMLSTAATWRFLNLLIPYSYTWAWSPSLKPRGIFFPVLVAALPSFATPPSNSWFSSCLSLQTPPHIEPLSKTLQEES